MWPATLGDELDLHEALTPFRTRDKGEWYNLTIGTLLEAISFTTQHLLAREEDVALDPCDFDECCEHSMVKVRVGPYKGMQGFFSYASMVPLQSISELYRSVALEHYTLDDGAVMGGEVYLEAIQETVWLPPVVLAHLGLYTRVM
jgi:hypothetical protein